MAAKDASSWCLIVSFTRFPQRRTYTCELKDRLAFRNKSNSCACLFWFLHISSYSASYASSMNGVLSSANTLCCKRGRAFGSHKHPAQIHWLSNSHHLENLDPSPFLHLQDRRGKFQRDLIGGKIGSARTPFLGVYLLTSRGLQVRTWTLLPALLRIRCLVPCTPVTVETLQSAWDHTGTKWKAYR